MSSSSLCCRQLFESIESRQHKWQCVVRIQFLEIHNEEVKDLLHPDIPSKVRAASACSNPTP